MKRSNILIIFLDITKPDTAFENRYKCLIKMVSKDYLIYHKKINTFSFVNIKLFRGLFLRCGILYEAIKCIIINRNYANKAFYFGYVDPLIGIILLPLLKISKTKIISEINEFPNAVLQGKKRNYFISKIEINLVDAYTIISDELISYYTRYTSRRIRILKLPMTVDESRFLYSCDYGNYIFYAGSFDNQKDGILYLINAFSSIKDKCNLNLLIAGTANNANDQRLLDDLVEKNEIHDRIKFLGRIGRDMIPRFMMKSKMLVLPRPNSKQAQGGFPSKLGEYLMSKRPVIVTKVGEISKYLSNSEVYFINADNIEIELEEKMIYIENNYQEAAEKAIRGYEVALRSFGLKDNSIMLNRFIGDMFNTVSLRKDV